MTQLTKSQMLDAMLTHQDELNSLINPQWRTAKYPWHTAIWTECAELMDHLGWKWWSKQECNMKQVKLEVADIWHFILSYKLQWLELINLDYSPYTDEDEPIKWFVEQLAASSASNEDNGGNISHDFFDLINKLGITFEELYKLHTAKYVLNKFRQMNGYKEGTYIKTWYDGREDNEHLFEYIAELSVTDDFEDKVLIGLNRLYAVNVQHAYEYMNL